jgi:hypothetical protein
MQYSQPSQVKAVDDNPISMTREETCVAIARGRNMAGHITDT